MDMITVSNNAGESFEIPKDFLQSITREYTEGFKDGFGRGFRQTFGVLAVSTAVVIGVSYGTLKFRQWRHNQKNTTE